MVEFPSLSTRVGGTWEDAGILGFLRVYVELFGSLQGFLKTILGDWFDAGENLSFLLFDFLSF